MRSINSILVHAMFFVISSVVLAEPHCKKCGAQRRSSAPHTSSVSGTTTGKQAWKAEWDGEKENTSYSCFGLCMYDESRTERVYRPPVDPWKEVETPQLDTRKKAELKVKFQCMNLCKGFPYWEGGAAWESDGVTVDRKNCELAECGCTKHTYKSWWVYGKIPGQRISIWDEYRGPIHDEEVECTIAKAPKDGQGSRRGTRK